MSSQYNVRHILFPGTKIYYFTEIYLFIQINNHYRDWRIQAVLDGDYRDFTRTLQNQSYRN